MRLKSVAVYILIFFLALEGMARISPVTKGLLANFWNTDFALIQKKDKFGFRGKRYAIFRDIRLNKYGFNDTDDYYAREKTHRIRIMCLGDSVTFGFKLPAHFDWPNLLENKLRALGVDAEVVNASIPGNNLPQIIERFEKQYIKFRPDIVLAQRDFKYYLISRFKSETAPPGLWHGLSEKSVFVKNVLSVEPKDIRDKIMYRRKKRNIGKFIDEISEESLTDYKRDLQRLIQICENNNITLVLSPYLYLINDKNADEFKNDVSWSLYFYPQISERASLAVGPAFNAATLEVARKNNILYVDTSKGFEFNKEYFIDVAHFTKKGAGQFAQNCAEALYNFIQK